MSILVLHNKSKSLPYEICRATTCFFICSACITLRKGNVSSSSIPLDTNYRIVGMAQGASKNFTILGLGAANKDALILDAKRNMYWNYALAPDERFTN